MVKRIYICHDNITGLYSALYDAWKERRETQDARIAFRDSVEQQLFCEYVDTVESEEKALAIERMIKKHLGIEAYREMYHAALADDSMKGDAIFGTMLAARQLSDSTKVMDCLTNGSVEKVFELSRKVSNEAHYFKQFLRFRELDNGILFSRIDPKSQILTCIAPHFAERLPLENWMIFDGTHRMCVVHKSKNNWVLVSGVDVDEKQIYAISESEREIQNLWKGFFDSISIEERRSRTRQRQHLPMWYRKNMVEFEKKVE